MKRLRAAFLFLCLFGALCPAAFGIVCTYDDLPQVYGPSGSVPYGYCGGLTVGQGAGLVHYFTNSYFGVRAHSQPNALLAGNSFTIGFGYNSAGTAPNTAAFSGFWAMTDATTCVSGSGSCDAVTLTYQQNLVGGSTYTGTVTLQPGVYTFVQSGYAGPAATMSVYVSYQSVNGPSDNNIPEWMAVDDITWSPYTGPACGTPTISPTAQQNVPITGGTGTITITDGSTCTWSVTSNVSWITITSGSSPTGGGTGNGSISYSVAANNAPGFRVGVISISGATLTIQETGIPQFQAQGPTTAGTNGTMNVIQSAPGTFAGTFTGTGWQPDGGTVTVSGQGFQLTYAPPNFQGSFRVLFPASSNPPCTAQITATQGSNSQTVTLTGVYLAKIVVPDTNETGRNAGDQICQTTTVTSAQQFLDSLMPIVQGGAFAIESAPVNLGGSPLGGSLFYVLNPHSSVQWGDGAILVNPGATVTFPDPLGNTVSFQGDGTQPIASAVFGSIPGIPYIPTGNVNETLSPNNTVLLVNGNVSVLGGVTGTGSLIATGNINIAGTVNLSPIFFPFVAGGNMTFTGVPPPSLTNVPGSLKQLSVGADGTVWGVNAQRQIYQYQSDPGWNSVAGSLTQVAVGSSTAIWGLNAQQQIYRWNPATSTWVNVAGSLTQIAVSPDGDAWGLNSQSSVFHYNAQTAAFIQVPGTLSQIAVGSSGAVYGINAAGAIYWYNPGSGAFEWIAGTGFTQVAAGVDSDLWAVKNNVAYHYNVLRGTMDATSGAAISQVTVGSGAAVYGLGPSGQIYQWNAATQTWTQIAGSLSTIALGGNGTLWGINANQQIYTTGQMTAGYQTLSWVPGSLTQISVGADGATWGLNGSTVEYFNSGTQSFQTVSGAPQLTQISVGANADVWGINSAGTVFQYAGPGTWNTIPGVLSFIQVGANHSVWGINKAGQIYTYNQSSQSWTTIPGTLAQLSVGADGAVWGINAQQQIYQFNAATQTWVNVPGSLTQISVGNANNVWGVNSAQQVYRYNPATQSWTLIPTAYLVDISVAGDGSVWGVNAGGVLYRWDSGAQNFTQVGSGMSKVFAGNGSAVWALSTSGTTFSWF